MSWLLRDPEIAAMLAADGKRRYEYFIHRVCDTQQIWSLHDGGWASFGETEGQKLLPLWPHEKYAEPFRTKGWESHTPKAIDLALFVEEWLPKMKASGVSPAIFPVSHGASVVVSCDELQANLRHESSNY